MTLTNYKLKLHNILRVMLPIFITQVAIMGLSFFDTVMSGHAGANDLAGVAIGGNLWMPVFTGFNGILMALTPIVAQLRGAERQADIPRAVFNGLCLAVAVGTLIIGAGYLALPFILDQMALTPEVRYIATGYLGAIALGIIPFFLSNILRSFVDTMGYTQMSMRIFLLTLPVNVCFNYLLIFGKLGFPRLGGIGAGYGSALTCWFTLLAFSLLIAKTRVLAAYHIFNWWGLELKRLQEHLTLGIPMGIAIFFETSIFGVVALFIAKFGTVAVAAHQAAMNFTSVLYMLPLSISMSLTILVGVEVGAGRYQEARAYATAGRLTNLGLASLFVILILTGRSAIAAFYSVDESVVAATRQFLLYTTFFQFLDGTAAPIQGILRAYKDVKVPFYIALTAYWLISLPVGLALDYMGGQGPIGYWQGLVIGVFFSAVLLTLRLIKVQKKQFPRCFYEVFR